MQAESKIITDIFKENVILEDERALLRPLQKEDAEHFHFNSEHEPDLWKYGQVTAAGKENLYNYFNDAANHRDKQKEYPFVVFDKLTGEWAGSTRFYDIQQQFASTQLGYTWYGKKFQRTGLNRHCKFLIFQFVFEQWGLNRLELRADIDNKPSIAAMKAIGCKEEGILREHMITVTGKVRSSIIFSVLREEWFKEVKDLLKRKIY
jgi:RimJ/RimL family protein N-acetyltransferase